MGSHYNRAPMTEDRVKAILESDIIKYGPCTSRGYLHYRSRSNTNQTITTRMWVKAAHRCYDIRLIYGNFYFNNGTEIDNSNSITVKAAVQIGTEGEGTRYPVYFNNMRDVVIPAGKVVISDPVPIDLDTDDEFYIRTYADAGVGGYLPGVKLYKNGFDGVKLLDAWEAATDKVDSGVLPTPGSGTTDTYAPIGIIATPMVRKPFVALIGGSSMNGTGDIGQLDTSNCGFAFRALGSKIGTLLLAPNSGRSDQFNAVCKNRIAQVTIGRANYAIVDYGRNEIDYGMTAEQIQAQLLILFEKLTARGMKVYACTVRPMTTSTDLWMTVENQTKDAKNAVRIAVNGWLRTVPSPLTGIFDLADAVESARDSGLWKAADLLLDTTATSGTTTSIRDTKTTFTPYQYNGLLVRTTKPDGTGEQLRIIENTYIPNNALLVLSGTPFSPAPEAGDIMQVYGIYTYDGYHFTQLGHQAAADVIDTGLFV